jgi:ABC-type dipeptide/oligopeptide/nickel transport system permease subunit
MTPITPQRLTVDMLLVLGINLLGDGLRDTPDPRQRSR